MTLRIAADFTLPDDAVTQAIAILARRGAGKTYTASVLVEEVIKAKLPVVPKDELGPATGYEASGGGFNNALSRLRTLELIERGTPRMSDDLA